MKKAILLILILFITTSFCQQDNTSAITSLQITPENPTISDQIQLTINALWSSGSCENTNHTVSTFGNNYEYNFYYNVGDLTVICNNLSTVNLGSLPVGSYTITCYINNNFAPSMQYEPMTITFTVTANNLSNQNFEQNNKLFAYPNPVENILTIENQNNKSIEIYNNLGQKIMVKNNLIDSKTEINFTEFEAGIYFLTTDNSLTKMTKIIKL